MITATRREDCRTCSSCGNTRIGYTVAIVIGDMCLSLCLNCATILRKKLLPRNVNP